MNTQDIVGIVFLLVYLAIIVLVIAGFWKMFVKAGQPGWAAIVPIYNIYVWLKIVGRPWWWLILFFIPIVNFIMTIVVGIDTAKSFAKSVLFGIGVALIPMICIPVLGFGSAQYVGPRGG